MKRLIAACLILSFFGVAARAADKKPAPSATKRPAASAPDDEDDDDDDGAEMNPTQKAPDPAAAAAATAGKAGQSGDENDDDDDENDDGTPDSPKIISANVTLASDYILRGISQTGNQPAIQGGFDWYSPIGINLGIWGSSVHPLDSEASLELDWYGGYTYHLTQDLSASLGLLYYSYFANEGHNNWMIPGVLEWKKFMFELSYCPNWVGTEGQAWYAALGWHDSFIPGGSSLWSFKLNALVGYSLFSADPNEPNYADFRVGVAKNFLDVEWTVNGYFVQPQTVNGETIKPRVVFSVTKAF